MTPGPEFGNRFLRSLQHRTAQRRGNQRRRTRTIVMASVIVVLLVGLSLPSLICYSSMGTAAVNIVATRYGWTAKADEIQVGWITPLKLNQVQLTGPSGETTAQIGLVETDITLPQMVSGISDFGRIFINGLVLNVAVADGGSSLEDDLLVFQSGSGKDPAKGQIELRDASVAITDCVSAATWNINGLDASVIIDPTKTHIDATAVTTDPEGASGSIQGKVVLPVADHSHSSPSGGSWTADFHLNSFSLSIVDLVKRRFSESVAVLPDMLAGDANGNLYLSRTHDGIIDVEFRRFELRKLTASDRRLGEKRWFNQRAMLSGALRYTDLAIVGNELNVITDFASATVAGTFATGVGDPRHSWFEAVDGSGSLSVDVGLLNRAAPGLLPIRRDVQLIDGKIKATVQAGTRQDGKYRSTWEIHSEPIRARSSGREVVIGPIQTSAVLSLTHGRLAAEKVKLTSQFGSVSAHGDLRSGDGSFDIDFGRLAAILQPIVTLPKASLAGKARGSIGWNADVNQQWRLDGKVAANDLIVSLSPDKTLRPKALEAKIQASGRWENNTLVRLTDAQVNVQQANQNCRANLLHPVDHPNKHSMLPFQVTAKGQITALAETIGPWLPHQLHGLEGNYAIASNLNVSMHGGELLDSKVTLDEPVAHWQQYSISQPFLKVDFDGQYAWPSGVLAAKSLTVSGDAVSFALSGNSAPQQADLEVAWRLDLERIQQSVASSRSRSAPQERRRNSPSPYEIQRASYQASTNNAGRWNVYGAWEGKAKVRNRQAIWELDTKAHGEKVAIIQPAKNSTASRFVGPMRPDSHADTQPRVVWAEPQTNVQGILSYDSETGITHANELQVSTNWLDTVLTGRVQWNEQAGNIELNGPTSVDMDAVGRRLTSLSGQTITLRGVHQTPIKIQVNRRADTSLALHVAGDLGWDTGEIAGVRFGKARVPVTLTETMVTVHPATVPVDQGRVNLDGRAYYRPGPLWFELEPGVVAENIRLTPSMTRTWLKYVAPLVANTTDIAGTVGLKLNQAQIVMDAPNRSRVRGALHIQDAQLTAGPLAQQVIDGVSNIRSISRGFQNQGRPTSAQTLMRLQTQVVDFELLKGNVSHRRLFMAFDDVELITSGSVSLESQLDLVAQVPLDRRWLGGDLRNFADETLSLPIRGSLNKPHVDASDLTRIAAQVGTKAIKKSATDVFQKQLSRGLDKLFGK